jgi:uncharacterized protein (TIGR02099 family)
LKTLFRFTRRAAPYFFLASLVAVALILSLLRFWLLPGISAFRPALEPRLGALIGETVRVETLSARLRGFHPELSLSGLHILDAQGQSAIRFATVRLNLDPFRTLAAGEPRFDRVEIAGPRLSLRRKEDGAFAIVGLTLQEQLPSWLLADGRIDLLDAEVDWQDLRTQAAPLFLGRVDLRLRNHDGRHHLGADFALPENVGRSLRLIVDAEGDLFTASGWRGVVYLEGHGIDAAYLAEGLPPSDLSLRAGAADAKIWLRWQGAWQSASGEFDVKAPIITRRSDGSTENQLSMRSLASRFSWQRHTDGGWRLNLSRFQPALRDPWPETRLAIEVHQQSDGALSNIAATASYLNLADLATVLHALPVLGEETTATLRTLAPQGTLEDVRLFHAPAAPLGEQVALCGRFRGVAFNAHGRMPGVSGLGGDICGTDEAGRASLSVTPGSLALTGLGLKRPVPLASLSAELHWRQTDTDWIVSLPSLSIHNQELTATGRLRAVQSRRPDASPFIDLEARLAGPDAAALKHYLPAVLIPDASAWLEQSLAGGRIMNANILFRSAAADFPFHRNEGTFEAVADVKNVNLRFHPDWLPLTHADARLAFHGPSLNIDVHRGRIGAGRIAEAHAVIADLDRNPRLALSGTARAGVADSLDFLAHSPLREIPERLYQFTSVSGTVDIALNLGVPLNAGPGSTTVDGTATFRRAALRIDDLGLEVRDIEGPLHFGHEGLRAEGIQARILDQPALIDVDREADDIQIAVRGRAGIAVLETQFPAAFWRHARGITDYRLTLRFPEALDAQNAPVRLALNSDLVGVALDLPAPFAKPESTGRTLTVETAIRTGDKTPLRLAYGQDFEARARLSEPERGLRLEGGDIAIGLPLPPDGKEPGLALFARLDEADAGEWRRWWTRNPTDGYENGTGVLRELQLHIGKLAWNGANLGSFALQLKQNDTQWKGRVDSGYAKGEISASPKLVSFDLDFLKLPRSSTDALAGTPDDSPEIDPAGVPSLRLRAGRLLWRDADLGRLELDTERHARGMVVKALTVAGRDHALELHGDWTHAPDRTTRTRLEGKAHVENLGDFLTALGHGGEVRDTPSDLAFALNWPGAPPRFSAGTVAGEIKLNLGKGGLLNVEPGLGRVIGMLNLNSLWRRLTFDFSDLFGQGLAYDGVGGTFRLGEGQAVTEGFLIDAVSAKIIVGGRAGLVARDLDQAVTVIPRTSTSAALPIAGALAGGPAVGAAIYAAQWLIGDEVDSIAATHYAIKGGWDDPAITRVHHSNMPLDMLDQAWNGVKNLSGFGSTQEEQQ